METASNTKTLWQNRDYVRLLSAQVISLIGTGVSSLCLALLAYDLAQSGASTVLSIAFALKMLAYIGLAPVFAVLSRAWPNKQVLVILDLTRAGLFICLPFVTQVWQVYILMFAINACSAAFTPLFQATLPQIVPNRGDYTKALSYSRLAFDMEQIISPILGALLLVAFTFRQLFWLDALTFVLSAILIVLCFIPSKQHARTTVERLSLSNVLRGLSDYLSKPPLRQLWFAYLAAASASAMVIVNTVVYVHDVLSGGDQQTALAMFIVGLGSMVVALMLPNWLTNHRPQRYHIRGLLVICAAFYVGTWLPGWFGFGMVCFALGIGASCIQTTSGLIINDVAQGEDAAPYFAAHFSLTHFWWLVTYLAAGLSASWLGIAGAYWVMFGVSVVSLLMYLLGPSKDKEPSPNS